MTAYLQVHAPDGIRLVVLVDDQRMALGKAGTNHVVIDWDPTVSRLHAILEPVASNWLVRDLDSTNGTFVNGERLLGERPLHNGDELRVGRTNLLFRDDAGAGGRTEVQERAPDLTRRETDVLVALCAPVLSGDHFTEPASIREIAEVLFVSDAAVKQHLTNLYEKFGIYDDTGGRRRVKLANEAIRRGSVSVADLRSSPPLP